MNCFPFSTAASFAANMAAVASSLAAVLPALIAVFPRSLVAALDRCDANVFVVFEDKAFKIS